MEKDIVIDIKLEQKEMLQLNYSLLYRSPVGILFTLAGLVMLGSAIESLTSDTRESATYFLPQLAMAVIILLYVPYIVYRRVSRKHAEHPFWKENLRYTINHETIDIQGESFHVNIAMANIKRARELQHWYVLMLDGRQGYFIPKNRFKNEEDRFRFHQLLEDRKLFQPMYEKYMPAGKASNIVVKIVGLFLFSISFFMALFVIAVLWVVITDAEIRSRVSLVMIVFLLAMVVVSVFAFRLGLKLFRRKKI